jgi:rhodanese-related sulfurtransferase
MRLITREELKNKIDKGDPFKLVFVLGEWHFRAKHIPGSINLENPERASEVLSKEDEIVVYCANITCPASIYAYNTLTQMGYKNVHRYAEGIQDWETAGYAVEGESFS